MAILQTSEIVLAAWEDQARLIPTLWGPPRRGKTFELLRCARQYTQSADNVVIWRPALDLPEDMGGLVRMRAGKAYYSTPPGMPQACLDAGGKGWVLIIDEIDKAQSETLCTMLSLLDHQRSIRAHRLPHLRIACAGNIPEAPIPEALLGRMIHLRFPSDDDAASRLRDYDALAPGAAWLPEVARNILRVTDIPLPPRVSGDDSLTALLSWHAWPGAHDPRVLSRIVEGLFRREDVPMVLGALEREELDEDHLGEWVKSAPLAVLVARFHQHISVAPAGTAAAALLVLGERAESDQSGEISRAYAALLETDEALAALGPGSPEIAARGSAAWRAAL